MTKHTTLLYKPLIQKPLSHLLYFTTILTPIAHPTPHHPMALDSFVASFFHHSHFYLLFMHHEELNCSTVTDLVFKNYSTRLRNT